MPTKKTTTSKKEPKKSGRPLLYPDPQELQEKIDEYFETLDQGKNPTVAGLNLFLGFSNRHGLWEYGRREGFSDIVERAHLRIEAYLENMLVDTRHSNKAGIMFNLKCNFGFKESNMIPLSIHVDSKVDVKDALELYRDIVSDNR